MDSGEENEPLIFAEKKPEQHPRSVRSFLITFYAA